MGTLARLDEAREAMGIEWMNQAEIVQAIPPAYARHVGYGALLWLGTFTSKGGGEGG